MLRFIKIVYPLVIIGVGVGFLLSFTYQSLEKRLAEAAKNEEILALKKVFPEAKDFNTKEIEGIEYYVAVDENGKELAHIFKTSNTGYGGPVISLVAITNGSVANVVIVSASKETPGLGTKINEKSWLNQFIGKKLEEIPLEKSEFKTKGVDAVSGATFSSLAVTRDIKDAFIIYKKLGYIVDEALIDSKSSATEKKEGKK
ncbi:MAG: FMN-binding protein [Brevinematales bacterium]|nr:FMN-binding protein [Brevinematales bacterium]